MNISLIKKACTIIPIIFLGFMGNAQDNIEGVLNKQASRVITHRPVGYEVLSKEYSVTVNGKASLPTVVPG